MKQNGPTLSRLGHILVVELAGPHGASADDLAEILSDLGTGSDIRVLVIVLRQADAWGREGASSGNGTADLAALISRIAIPVVAAIEGDAVGPTLELAMACDIRVGTRGAKLGLPDLARGKMCCAGGTQRLPRLVGLSRAADMMLTGHCLSADEALRIGLLDRVVEPHALTAAATGLAAGMSDKAPVAMRFTKEALYAARDVTLEQGMRTELDLYLLLFSTADRVEGITAFQQKRRPHFAGR